VKIATRLLLVLATLFGISLDLQQALGQQAVPDKLVVLTFDDSSRSHYDFVRPILSRYGFSATFFITEGFSFKDNKTDYMSWQQIAQLHRDGFEIGNHTRDHQGVTADSLDQLAEQLEGIASQCEKHGIPRPISFAYPGNAIDPGALPILSEHGIQLARRGGHPEYPYDRGQGVAFQPGFDHPLLIPSAGDARPDWTLDNFRQAVEQAQRGKIAVLQFHGVPDGEHDWVSLTRDRFTSFMNYLAVNEYKVIALRDLRPYLRQGMVPNDPLGIIKDRQQSIAAGVIPTEFRTPRSRRDARYWISVMMRHGYSPWEMRMANGMDIDRVRAVAERTSLPRAQPGQLEILPYPGGRHPRIGFRDGALRPHRETKASVFLPWDPASYVVIDVPEAIWHDRPGGRQLLYLAHTHIPTRWGREGQELATLEWQRASDGSLTQTRRLPNNVTFTTSLKSSSDAIRMELRLHNGSDEQLSGLAVQNCVMLRAAPEFNQQTIDNKQQRGAFIACASSSGDRWAILAWDNYQRSWGNQFCPCMHSDPRFPDCAPGESHTLRGWLSFYEGQDLDQELDRIESLGWLRGTSAQ